MKVSMAFKLSGRSLKVVKKADIENFSTKDIQESVKKQVEFHFGDRPTVFANNSTDGLGFYSAGWFVSQDKEPTELVVVAYGSSMANATNNLMSYVPNVDWTTLAQSING